MSRSDLAGMVRKCPTLDLRDVYATITYYLPGVVDSHSLGGIRDDDPARRPRTSPLRRFSGTARRRSRGGAPPPRAAPRRGWKRRSNRPTRRRGRFPAAVVLPG